MILDKIRSEFFKLLIKRKSLYYLKLNFYCVTITMKNSVIRWRVLIMFIV